MRMKLSSVILVAFCAVLKGESMAVHVCSRVLLQKEPLAVAGKALICVFENLCMFYKKGDIAQWQTI